MDPRFNPFKAGPGVEPIELFGREQLLSTLDVYIYRVAKNSPDVPTIVYGLRGTGKTVVLKKAEEIAKGYDFGYITYRMEVDEKQESDFKVMMMDAMRAVANRLGLFKDLCSRFSEFIAKFKGVEVGYGGASIKLPDSIEPSYEISGNFAHDLKNMMIDLGALAKAKNRPMYFLIDEVQALAKEDLAALLGAMHRVIQDNLPIAFTLAGLPNLLSKIPEAKSYGERFGYVQVGPLSEKDVTHAYRETFGKRDVEVSPEAMQALLRYSGGYPFFIQQFGHDTWNVAQGGLISEDDVDSAHPIALAALDAGFFQTPFRRSTPAERAFMDCMASQQGDVYYIEDIVRCLNKASQSQVSVIRKSLINKGYIYEYERGMLAFTVPMFNEFLHRRRGVA